MNETLIVFILALLALLVVMLAVMAASFRENLVSSFKISYYEQKLINIGVDIEHIQKIKTLKEVIDI